MDDAKNYINLVLTVKKYPALYDLSCNDYHNRIVRNKMWRAVAQEVNAPAAECKEKWKNLRASFSRHLRNQNSANSKTKKPYYMADYMDFLLPYSKRRPDDNLNDDGPITQEAWNEEETASDTSFGYEKLNKSEQKVHEPEREEDARNEEHAYSRSKVIRLADDRLSAHKCTNNCVFANKRDPDESANDSADLLFFKSLLPDVRQMSRHEKRNFKISVLRLIDKILTERESSMSVENDVPCFGVKNQQEENDEDQF